MKKKILSICLIVSLLAIAIVGGTLAYFTDTDKATNTFTIGNVDIELLESQLHRQNDNATDEQIIADAETYQKDYLAKAGEDMVPGRWVKKAPYVYNTGKNPAYVRIKMTIKDDLFKVLDMMLYTTGFNAGAMVMDEGASNGDGTTTYTFTYTEALEPGEMTYYAPFWQFKIMDNLDNDDLVAFAGENIVNEIEVVAEAIQAEDFADYKAAFAAYDAQAANP